MSWGSVHLHRHDTFPLSFSTYDAFSPPTQQRPLGVCSLQLIKQPTPFPAAEARKPFRLRRAKKGVRAAAKKNN
jgi:hypothetical protein